MVTILFLVCVGGGELGGKKKVFKLKLSSNHLCVSLTHTHNTRVCVCVLYASVYMYALSVRVCVCSVS